jgi:hypothetical protein
MYIKDKEERERREGRRSQRTKEGKKEGGREEGRKEKRRGEEKIQPDKADVEALCSGSLLSLLTQ